MILLCMDSVIRFCTPLNGYQSWVTVQVCASESTAISQYRRSRSPGQPLPLRT